MKTIQKSSLKAITLKALKITFIIALGIACLAACGRPTPAPPSDEPVDIPSDLTGCINFEDQTLSTTFTNGKSISAKTTASDIVTIQVMDFNNMQGWTSTGPGATVMDNMPLNGGNNSIFLNNVNLGFNIETSECVKIDYCDVGGNVNLLANNVEGIDQDLNLFTSVDFNGVRATVDITDAQNNCGTVQLEGKFQKYLFRDKWYITFGIGGQELYIDNICPCGER